MPRCRYDLRLCLYGEVARIYSRYEHLAYHSSLPITVRSKTDAYRTAMQVPEMYYRLREKHFFDGLYRTMLGFDSERKRPVVAKAVIAYIDEALMLGRLDRTLFRKHL